MNRPRACFIGIDLGTQGCRAVLTTDTGDIVAAHESEFPLNEASREEQSPEHWWETCLETLRKLAQDARNEMDLSLIKALTVTSTSGTVIPLDKHSHPLHNALMYSDKRSANEAMQCKIVAQESASEGFTSFNSSCGLPKMIWFMRNFPKKAERLARWAHATDYILGRLSGTWHKSDPTNVLKSGFDLKNERWPAYINQQLAIRPSWLPEVVPSGTPIGTITPGLAAELGLPASIVVTAGMTDGCASQVASGAVALGMWNTTIGTTLVIKGVTRNPLNDPEGRFYSHRHPEGFWMPGGASNTGADWVADFKGISDLKTLDEQASRLVPGKQIAYPLRQEGERFPFIAPEARGFGPDIRSDLPGASPVEIFLANMEGVAYVERYAYELAEALSGETVQGVYSAGGGSNNNSWLRIRSNVLNKPFFLMKNGSGAMGAAILAASKTHFKSIGEAAKAMTCIEKTVQPEPALASAYQMNYLRFLEIMREKKYIK